MRLSRIDEDFQSPMRTAQEKFTFSAAFLTFVPSSAN